MKNSNRPNDVNKPNQPGFRILFRKDEKYYFQFCDATGEPLLFSHRGYTTEKGCQNGIEALLRIIGEPDNYEVQKSKKEKYFFSIRSANHKEIARSAMFDTKKEMQEKMELVRGIKEDIPVFGIGEVPEEEEKAVAVKGEKEKPPVTRSAPKPESTENMPRYKFSIIYYPDSKIWMLKNDFSGYSKKLKTCSGQQIERFLLDSLPPEEQKTAKPKETAPATVSQPKKKVKAAPREVELSVCTSEGEVVRHFAKSGKLEKVEVALFQGKGSEPAFFQGQVIAKSLEDNKRTVVGKVGKQQPAEGRFVIPIRGANYLKPGLYLLVANINQGEEGIQSPAFYGSQLVELN